MCYLKNYKTFISDMVQLVEDLEVNTVFEKVLSLLEKFKKVFLLFNGYLMYKKKNKIEKLNI